MGCSRGRSNREKQLHTRVLSTNLELYMSEGNYPDRKTNQRSNLMRTAISGYSQARESNLPLNLRVRENI